MTANPYNVGAGDTTALARKAWQEGYEAGSAETSRLREELEERKQISQRFYKAGLEHARRANLAERYLESARAELASIKTMPSRPKEFLRERGLLDEFDRWIAAKLTTQPAPVSPVVCVAGVRFVEFPDPVTGEPRYRREAIGTNPRTGHPVGTDTVCANDEPAPASPAGDHVDPSGTEWEPYSAPVSPALPRECTHCRAPVELSVTGIVLPHLCVTEEPAPGDESEEPC